jgi:hypothetical protein
MTPQEFSNLSAGDFIHSMSTEFYIKYFERDMVILKVTKKKPTSIFQNINEGDDFTLTKDNVKENCFVGRMPEPKFIPVNREMCNVETKQGFTLKCEAVCFKDGKIGAIELSDMGTPIRFIEAADIRHFYK